VPDLVDEHRAAVATLVLVGAEHEVVLRVLAAPLEQVEQGHLAVGTFEAVGLRDLVHRWRRRAAASRSPSRMCAFSSASSWSCARCHSSTETISG
jgi:hypothetical protein